MPLVEVKYQIDNDFKEIADFLDGVAGKVLAKASLDEHLKDLSKLMAAVDGYKNALDAMSSAQRNECLAYLIWKLAERFAPDEPKEETPNTETNPSA